MTEPMRRLQNGRSVADRRVRQPDSVGRSAIANLLLEVRGGEEPGPRRCYAIEPDGVNLHGLGNVLEVLPPEFAKGQIKPAADMIQHLARNADAAAIGDAFEPGRDIDPVAENVGAVRDDFAEIDTNAEFYAPIRWHLRISLEHTSLNRDRAADCVHDTTEFRDDAVAGGVGDTAAMRFHRGIPEAAPMILQLGERAFLVDAHQAAVSSHIRGKNGRKVTFNSRSF